MERIVECVPNISDGRNPEVYNAVAKACEKVPGVKLLDVDPGATTNRTVITFAGTPEVIVDGAFEVVKAAKEMIDMRGQTGEHARMGATDVCPFVPVSGVTLDECADLARQLAKRVGEELNVWAYLYEHAASRPEWKSLTNVREGEYEGLASRQGKAEWKPDFGPDKLDPKFGAVAVGARKFLVAYNINMNSMNKKMSTDIAMNIKESGRKKREFYPDGPFVRDADGNTMNQPGKFKECKAGAWIIPEYNCAQITMNLTDIDVSPVHLVFDDVCTQAQERGMRVTGSEIVGLVPLQTILDAGNYFLKKQGMSTGVSEEDVVRTAILTMGLSDVSEFKPEEKIVEYRFRKTSGRLIDMNITDFANTLASDEPAPGGGSIAALGGTLAASLATMVSNLTFGNKKHKKVWAEMEEIGVAGQKLKAWFLDAVDRDTDSFNAVIDAMRLPKKSDEDKKIRDVEIQKANQHCLMVPLEVCERTVEIMPLLEKVAQNGNPNCASDAGVGAYCALTCAEGAALNVRINLSGIEDEGFKKEAVARVEKALESVRSKCQDVVAIVEKNL